MHPIPRIIYLCLVGIVVLASVSLAHAVIGTAVPPATGPAGFLGYVPDAVVVEFEEGVFERFDAGQLPRGRTGIRRLDRLFSRYGAGRIRRQFPGARTRLFRGRLLNLARWHKIHFRHKVDVEKVAAAFKELDGVIDAQPIGIHAVALTPNESSFPDQWHLDQINDHDIDGPEAWNFETGSDDIVVAVIDTGVRWFHKDLGGSNAVYFETPRFDDTIDGLHGADGNLWTNDAEVNGTPGVDDDGNGYIDDMIGWDFVNFSFSCWRSEDCFFEDNDPRDFEGHGTHLAGIIAALNNNGYSISSTAGGWGNGSLQPGGNGVKIMPLRIGYAYVSNPRIGVVQMDLAAEALRYAADNGARLANASWGSSNTGGLGAAIDYFLSSGGLIFKAAGNSDNETADYMGQRADVINVAATGQLDVDPEDQDDCKANYSSYGTWVDISAPGSEILSTWQEYSAPDQSIDYIAWLSGTSMASPLALSVAALIWSQHPSWSADMVKRHLFNSADAIEGLTCNASYSGKLGAGRVNAYNAVGPCAGDLDNNGTVDGSDLVGFIIRFDSGQADEIDLEILSDYFGRAGCPLR